mmetsp:Transcript_97557/g.271491  ORF Transcript_97557/g.271491 Transcript_97557/m.271491 type:complete len:106 (-) Transcript_97557:171-488(-)
MRALPELPPVLPCGRHIAVAALVLHGGARRVLEGAHLAGLFAAEPVPAASGPDRTGVEVARDAVLFFARKGADPVGERKCDIGAPEPVAHLGGSGALQCEHLPKR